MPNLEREHFEVLDNGVVQQLTKFESDVQPIKVVVMLDTSGSMTLHLKLLKLAAEQFVLRLLPEDRARIGSFSDKITMSPTFTGDRDDLIRFIHNEIQFGNPTHLWDAIDASMTALSREQGRRVVLIFTDGADMYSRKTSFDEVLARALKEEFMIYSIGLHGFVPGQGSTRPDRGLRRLSEETGGGYFELKNTADLGSDVHARRRRAAPAIRTRVHAGQPSTAKCTRLTCGSKCQALPPARGSRTSRPSRRREPSSRRGQTSCFDTHSSPRRSQDWR